MIENIKKYNDRINIIDTFSFIKENKNSINENVFNDSVNNENTIINTIEVDETIFHFISKNQNWDKEYFGFPCRTIEYILFEKANQTTLNKAINIFLSTCLEPKTYCIMNVPAEDLLLVQAFSNTNFKLIETRLNYVLKIDKNIKSKNNLFIKKAELKDVNDLREVAKKMRNKFDRVHADNTFTTDVADNYLAKFAEESIKGFADNVLKTENNQKAHGFLAANNPIQIDNYKISKLVLAAIDNKEIKGRLSDLLHEMICILNEKGTDYLTTITQAANVPAIKTWEKFGFSLYKVSHLYSFKND